MPIWFPLGPGIALPTFTDAADLVTVPPSTVYPSGATIPITTYIQHLDDGDDVGQGQTSVSVISPAYNETVRFSAPVRIKVESQRSVFRSNVPLIPVASYTFIGNDAALQYSIFNVETGEFNLSGNAINFTYDQIYQTGNFTLTGNDVTFSINFALTADVAQFTLTGNDTTLTADRLLGTTTGTFTLTGNDVKFLPIILSVSTGTFALTGNDAIIGFTINTETAQFTLTGNAIDLTVDSLINAATGTFALTGNAVTLDYSGGADADFNAYIAEVELIDSQTLETPIKDAIEEFYVGTKADGNYAALKAATLLMGARTRLGSYVDMITATTDLSSFNFADDDYSRITGLEGDGSTTYLDSGRAGNADDQNDAHISAYITVRNKVVSNNQFFVASGVTNPGSIQLVDRDSDSGQRVKSSTFDAGGPILSVPTLFGVSRSNPDDYTRRINGLSSTISQVSDGNNAGNITVFTNTNPGDYASARIAFYSIGESVDLALLDQRVTRMVNLIQYYLYTGEDGAAYDTDTLIYVNNGYANGGGL